ncbi:hypothetical protein BC829DRAFT_492936 [Chytridium lagenaria]|nr:hypothetical protein BC829DRAFT_492936 [Chytridium lagenaria]
MRSNGSVAAARLNHNRRRQLHDASSVPSVSVSSPSVSSLPPLPLDQAGKTAAPRPANSLPTHFLPSTPSQPTFVPLVQQYIANTDLPQLHGNVPMQFAPAVDLNPFMPNPSMPPTMQLMHPPTTKQHQQQQQHQNTMFMTSPFDPYGVLSSVVQQQQSTPFGNAFDLNALPTPSIMVSGSNAMPLGLNTPSFPFNLHLYHKPTNQAPFFTNLAFPNATTLSHPIDSGLFFQQQALQSPLAGLPKSMPTPSMSPMVADDMNWLSPMLNLDYALSTPTVPAAPQMQFQSPSPPALMNMSTPSIPASPAQK